MLIATLLVSLVVAIMLSAGRGFLVSTPRWGSLLAKLAKGYSRATSHQRHYRANCWMSSGGLMHESKSDILKKNAASTGNIFSGMNPEQVKAIVSLTGGKTSGGGEPDVTIVLAGAGSGKTRVIVHRLAYLSQDLKVPPNAIVATTFTNKAANEITERVASLLNSTLSPEEVQCSMPKWVGTFHSLCYRMLLLNADLTRVKNATFLDEKMQKVVVKKILLPAGTGSGSIADDNKTLKDMIGYINAQKDMGLRAKTTATATTTARSAGCSGLVAKDVYAEYERTCKVSNYMDFNEVLLRTYELLRDHSAVLHMYRRQFRYIHVDEYQDTNTIQYKILRLLINGGEVDNQKAPCSFAIAETDTNQINFGEPQRAPSLFVVGDDDQAIYGFRGAYPGIMQQVKRDYPHCALIKLTQNYRSTSTILSAANAVIANNVERLGKELWTSHDHPLDEPIHVHNARDEENEANFVAASILRRTSEGKSALKPRFYPQNPNKKPEKRDFAFRDIAVIVRTHRQARALEKSFKFENIPYEIRGGFEFFEREEIRHILAYLSLVTNRQDNLAFERVFNTPARGMSGSIMEELEEYSKQHGVTLWQAAVVLCAQEGLSVSLSGEVGKDTQTVALDALSSAVEDLAVTGKRGPRSKTPKAVKATAQQKGALALAKFLQLINNLDAVAQHHSVIDVIKHTIIESGLYDYYAAGALKHTKAALIYQTRMENLVELVDRVNQRVSPHAESEGQNWVISYRKMVASGAENRSFVPEKKPLVAELDDLGRTPLQKLLHDIMFDVTDSEEGGLSRDAVQLTTIHGAKGLEFPVVFLCGAEEGILPFGDSFASGLQSTDSKGNNNGPRMYPPTAYADEDMDALQRAMDSINNNVADSEETEESRRLFYVAITRAKKVLYLTHSQSRFGTKMRRVNIRRSKFIDEINPQSLLYNCRI